MSNLVRLVASLLMLALSSCALALDESADILRVEESTKVIQCLGARPNELVPESKIVAVNLVSPSKSAGLSYSSVVDVAKHQQANSSKQSQEFDIQPAVNISASSTTTAQPESVPTTSNSEIVSSSSPAPASTSSSTSEPATTGATLADQESTQDSLNVANLGHPVASKTIRQGSAVFCGEANPNGKSNKRLVLDRIVGGRKTEPGEFPFQVRLNIRSRRGSGICGGVILDERHILTAAHCMTACVSQYLSTTTIELTGVHATIGDHSIKSNDGELEIELEKITPHEKYDACNFYANDHDIALIKTREPIEYRFTSDGYGSINRPCMPNSRELAYRDSESVIVSGWGVTRENSGSLSNILRYVQVPIVNTTRCQETYGSRVTSDHICAGYQSGGRDSCQGDSGGPLVRVVDNRYELVGIVSFGYGCGQPGAPGVYTRVASYIDWIKANL